MKESELPVCSVEVTLSWRDQAGALHTDSVMIDSQCWPAVQLVAATGAIMELAKLTLAPQS